MKISEFITHLESVYSEIGDVDVQLTGYYGRCNAGVPTIQFKAILKGRERRPRCWTKYDGPEHRGEPVCFISSP